MTYYCRIHPDFEGLDQGKLHDHIERDHPEIKTKAQIAEYFRENIEETEFRKSDGRIISRTWGRVPKLGTVIADNQREK